MKYMDVYEDLLSKIQDKTYKNGDRLPSIRALSGKYACNKSTVMNALALLEERHYCYSLPRSGYYVIQEKSRLDTINMDLDLKHVRIFKDHLPYKAFQHCIHKAVSSMDSDLYQYSHVKGLSSLRKTLAKQLFDEGIYTGHEDLVITSGAIHGLNFLLQILRADQTSLLIESPTYNSLIQMIHHMNLSYEIIERKNNTYDFDRLKDKLKTVDYFYIMANHHNPLGESLTKLDKQKLIKLCHEYKVTIIEDDYLQDILSPTHHRSLKYYDHHDNVIYVRSFSKGFLPSIRLGYVAFPKSSPLLSRFTTMKRLHDYCTCTHTQYALDYFIQTGMYNKHKTNMQKIYKKRMATIKKSSQHLLDTCLQVNYDQTGIFIYLKFLKPIKHRILNKLLQEKHIQVSYSPEFFMTSEENLDGIRICIADHTTEVLVEGIKEIMKTLRQI